MSPVSAVTHLQLLAVPLAKLWTVVSCDLGIHFTCSLHACDPEYAIFIFMHLVCHFASISLLVFGHEVCCLSSTVYACVATATGDMLRRRSHRHLQLLLL